MQCHDFTYFLLFYRCGAVWCWSLQMLNILVYSVLKNHMWLEVLRCEDLFLATIRHKERKEKGRHKGFGIETRKRFSEWSN
jgi:hypothetical protein